MSSSFENTFKSWLEIAEIDVFVLLHRQTFIVSLFNTYGIPISSLHNFFPPRYLFEHLRNICIL